jgi:hypothetical protein
LFHHYRSLGGWTVEFSGKIITLSLSLSLSLFRILNSLKLNYLDYYSENITAYFDTDAVQKMADIIDPYGINY